MLGNMCIVIIYLLVSDFINFQINLSFFIKLFYYMIKSQDKHLSILRTK